MRSALPLISCICPTFGKPKLLEEAIQSFLLQDYPNKELIIFNNFAEQDLHLDLAKFSGITIINYKGEIHGSTGACRNLTIEHARGELMAPWDDDDISLPWRLSYSYQRLAAENADCVLHPAFYTEHNQIQKQMQVHPSDCIVRMEAYRAVGGYSDWNTEDQDLIASLRCHKYNVYLDPTADAKIAYLYRWATESFHISGEGADTQQNGFDSRRRMIEWVKAAGFDREVWLMPRWSRDYVDDARRFHHELAEFASPVERGVCPTKDHIVGSWEQQPNRQCLTFCSDGSMSPGEAWSIRQDGLVVFGDCQLRMNPDGALVGWHMPSQTRVELHRVPSPRFAPTRARKIRLFVQVYRADHPDRQGELLDCLRWNEKNPLLEVVRIDRQERVAFSELFEKVNQVNGEDDISIIANSDIVFDETVELLLHMHEHDVYCLSRYEGANELYGRLRTAGSTLLMNPGGHDAWCFRGKLRPVSDCDFGPGIWGCDGALAHRLRGAGYQAFNPSYSIKIYHWHNTNVRTNQFPSAPKPWDTVSHVGVSWSKTPEPQTRVLACVLHGSDQRSVEGAFAIARGYRQIFPGFRCHLAIGDDVHPDTVAKLEAMVDVVSRFPTAGAPRAMLQRGLADGDVVVYRDIEAKLSSREFRSIEHWLSSPHDFCLWHDHRDLSHAPIGGGTWAVRGRDNVRWVIEQHRSRMASLEASPFRDADHERWLADTMFPQIKDRCLDFHSCGRDHGAAEMIKLEPRDHPLDVIGDGIGIHPGELANLKVPTGPSASPYLHQAFQSTLPPAELVRVVFELGSFDGRDAIALAQYYTQAHVYAFEPHTPSYQRAMTAIEQSGVADRIHLYNLAVGDAEGMRTFHPFDLHPIASSFFTSRVCPELHSETAAYDVPMVRIEDFCRREGINKIDFLCADLQGYELAALRGTGPMLGGVTRVILEVPRGDSVFRDAPSRAEVLAAMGAWGFEPRDAVYENVNEENVMFVRPASAPDSNRPETPSH